MIEGFDVFYYYLNLIIYFFMFLFCLCIAVTIGTWCFYIDRKETSFAFWFFLGVAGIKVGFALLFASNIAAMVDGNVPPLWTLVPRIVVLTSLSLHFYLIRRVRPVQMDSVQFRKKEDM